MLVKDTFIPARPRPRPVLNRGSILVIVMLLTVILFALTAIVGQNALSNMDTTAGTMTRKQVRYAAFAGLQDSLAHLNSSKDPNYGVKAPAIVTGSLVSNPALVYTCTLENNLYNDLEPAGTVPPGAVRIDSKGSLQDSGVSRELLGLNGIAIQFVPSFDQAIISSNITISGSSRTMAFDFHKWTGGDRAAGYYAANASTIQADQDPTWKKGGKVVSSSPNVAVNASGFIDGDLSWAGTTTTSPKFPLFSATPKDLGLTKSEVSGNITHVTAANVVPTAQAPDAHPADPNSPANNPSSFTDHPVYATDAYGNVIKDAQGHPIVDHYDPQPLTQNVYQNLTVPKGQAIVLSKGTYYIADTLQIDGKLLVEGNDQVVLYVGKKMVVTGNVNFQGSPANLQTYFTDEDKTPDPGEKVADADKFAVSRLVMQGGSATMVVAGANLRAQLDNSSRLLGSLITGSNVSMDHNSTLEYDTGLAGQSSALKSEWKLTGVHEK